MADTHTVMPKKLAQALMEAGMTHFDGGGSTAPSSGGNPYGTAAGDFQNGYVGQGIMSASNPSEAINGIGQGFQGLGQMFTAKNDFQASAPGITLQDLSAPIGTTQMQSQAVYNNQANLANTLMTQARGQGPNPALAQLHNTTAQNVQNQGALMASQRGASSNPALIARQAAMQGGAMQQQATGQAAALGAQQQINAQQQLAGIYGQQGNQAIQEQSVLQGAHAAQNSAITTGQLGAQQINAGVAAQNTNAQNATTGGIIGAVGGGGASMLNKGGMVRKMADGGIADYSVSTNPNLTVPDYGGNSFSSGAEKGSKLGSSFGKALKKRGGSDNAPIFTDASSSIGEGTGGGGGMQAISNYDEGGDIGSSDNVGIAKYGDGIKLPGSGGDGEDDSGGGAWAKKKQGGGGLGSIAGLAALFADGGQISFSKKLLDGGKVPGKAEVKGNSEKNDTQPTLLSAGEVVLPRSVTMAKDAPKKAMEFMAHIQATRKGKGGYGEVIKAKKMCGGGRA